MAQTDALKKYLDAGMAFTSLTRARAEQVVKELVAAGELQRNQTKGAIDDLLERSKKNAEALSEQVRKEVDSQLASLGLARKADVERLEAELAKLRGGGDEGGAGGSEVKAGKKAPEKKAEKSSAPEKKAPAKKAAAKGDQGPAERSDKPEAEKIPKTAKAARKSGGQEGAGAAGALPGREAADDESKAPAKKAQATRKKGSQDGAGAAGALPGREAAESADKKPAKKTTKKQG